GDISAGQRPEGALAALKEASLQLDQRIGNALHGVPPLFERGNEGLRLLDIAADMRALALAAAQLGEVLARPEIFMIDLQVVALAFNHLGLEAAATLADDNIGAHMRGGHSDLIGVGIEAVGRIRMEMVTDELPFGLDDLGSLADESRDLTKVAER